MTFRTSRVSVTEFELGSVSQKGIAVLAPVDCSGIIQPVPTKMMKKCMVDYKKYFCFKIVALMMYSV